MLDDTLFRLPLLEQIQDRLDIAEGLHWLVSHGLVRDIYASYTPKRSDYFDEKEHCFILDPRLGIGNCTAPPMTTGDFRRFLWKHADPFLLPEVAMREAGWAAEELIEFALSRGLDPENKVMGYRNRCRNPPKVERNIESKSVPDRTSNFARPNGSRIEPKTREFLIFAADFWAKNPKASSVAVCKAWNRTSGSRDPKKDGALRGAIQRIGLSVEQSKTDPNLIRKAIG